MCAFRKRYGVKTMDELLKQLLADDMAALEGLQLSGSVPVSTDLINGVIAQVLAEGLPGSGSNAPIAATSAPVKANSSMPRLDPKALLKLVKRAEVKADNGKIMLQFEVRR